MDLIHNWQLLGFFTKSSRLNCCLLMMTVAVIFEFKRVETNSFLKYGPRIVIFLEIPMVYLTAMSYSIIDPTLS